MKIIILFSMIVLFQSCETKEKGINGNWEIDNISVDTNKLTDSLSIDRLFGLFLPNQAEKPTAINIKGDSIYLLKDGTQLLANNMLNLKKADDHSYTFVLENTEAKFELMSQNIAKLSIEGTTYNLKR